MIRGLLRKTLFETWVQLLLFTLGLFIVTGLLTMLLPQLERGANQVLATLPFARRFLQALLGEDFGPRINIQMVQAIIWVHPTVLALLWAQEIVFCTRVPAGEVDRGTIDILLSWPTTRRTVYAVESLVWLGTGVLLCLAMLFGHYAARFIAQSFNPAPASRVMLALLNLYCLYLAVGGIALAISAASNHRGRAMGVVFVVVLASFLLNFIVQFWPTIENLAPLSVLNYYRPAEILSTGQLPIFNITVLLSVALVAWIAGLEVFARRSITTV